MKSLLNLILGSAVCAALFGCAHPITLNPDLQAIQNKAGAPIDQKVGFYISDASKALEVTTPGGGGDKVRYFPYRDMEAGFYKALSEAYKSVSKTNGPRMTDEMRNAGISLLLVPEITTTSSSSSAFTWPPTQFTVKLAVAVLDSANQLVRTLTVTGEGKAEFDEFKSNFSLSTVRASNDALAKLVAALTAPGTAGASGSAPAGAQAQMAQNTSQAVNDGRAINGRWAGKYVCGPYQGTANVANRDGFTDSATLVVDGAKATMRRGGSNFSETVTGELALDMSLVLKGQGAMTATPDRPWNTEFSGKFAPSGGATKFVGTGRQTVASGAIARECSVELARLAN